MDGIELWNSISAGGFPLLAFLVLWTGYKRIWVWGSENESTVARAERAEADRDRATTVIEDKLIPAVIEFTHAANKVLDVKEARERPPES